MIIDLDDRCIRDLDKALGIGFIAMEFYKNHIVDDNLKCEYDFYNQLLEALRKDLHEEKLNNLKENEN